MKYIYLFICTAFLTSSCGAQGSNKSPFAEARKSFTTQLIKSDAVREPLEPPPAQLFRLVAYPASIGNMPAYLSNIPQDGTLRPAMVWLTGGLNNDIGDVWSEQESDNDQSAAAIRKTGIIMMYPAQRGGNTSPGNNEICYGEVDDIIAAAQFLAKQPGVDPKRIYLGGHSTGGTKAILAAEASGMFRAIFSFGPVNRIDDYGTQYYEAFDTVSPKELEMRSPVLWLSSLTAPLFVFEGTYGNYAGLKYMQQVAKKEGNVYARFYELKEHDHFSGLQQTCTLIAQKIMADTNATVNIQISSNELPEYK
ncbi:Alpha/beta hydrolase family protein [compost metagenome]